MAHGNKKQQTYKSINIYTYLHHLHCLTHKHAISTHTHTNTPPKTHPILPIIPLFIPTYVHPCRPDDYPQQLSLPSWPMSPQITFINVYYTSYDGISGIVLKESSVKFTFGLRDFPLSPRNATSVLFRSVNLILVLKWFITWQYSSLVLFEICSAIFLWNLVHSGAIPPVVEKTKGVKLALSTWIILWL